MNSDDVEVRTERTASTAQADGSQAGDYRAGRAYRGQLLPASTYGKALPAIALMAGAAAFGASALSLGIFGLGAPFLLAAVLASVWAGLLMYVLGRWALSRAARGGRVGSPDTVLGQEMRGALQPALLVSDRLLKHDDPAIRRAGEAVARSIDRATALIVQENEKREGS